ncbi:MAG TPA: DEAD/DEAH box helicase [Gemmatimonadales bacterium]|nr:DEAD/DEAH box helicase [Gemmatimonadales bacterium]
MRPIATPSATSPRILAESLRPLEEPLALLVTAGPDVSPPTACRAAALALLDLPVRSSLAPDWLQPHQVPAHTRLLAILARFGGAVLADAVGLGKSYIALAVAKSLGAPLCVVAPAVLAPQWRALMDRLEVAGRFVTHESLSRRASPDGPTGRPGKQTAPLLIVDEAHHFREPGTLRYHALARLALWARVLLVTATPVHNRPADLLHLLRLFLRDDALVGLGVPSLTAAARAAASAPLTLPALARIVVARSRRRVVQAWKNLPFPRREGATLIRAATVEPHLASSIAEALQSLQPPGGAAALVRLTLLRQFASSVPALTHSLRRYEAFCDVSLEAARTHRRLGSREFRRLFPPGDESSLQLAFLPLLLDEGHTASGAAGDLETLRWLLQRLGPGPDPKADALERLVTERPARTIVFTTAAATVHHVRRRLMRRFRVGAVTGRSGWLAGDRVSRQEVIAAFAPRAQRAPQPAAACIVDVLIATDLLSEGLDLQDAARVVHYDLPWSPARVAQRVGRIDRMSSPHPGIRTIAFLPPGPLARALALEHRLALKVSAQLGAGAAQVERVSGADCDEAPLDWCDRLQRLAAEGEVAVPPGVVAAVASNVAVCVLVVRLGTDVEAIVVEDGRATADAVRATALLEQAQCAAPRPVDRGTLSAAVRAALPVLRERLEAIAMARWRAADRDHIGRRLVPLALAAARRAARSGRPERLARLDALVSRLTGGQTAGEALSLEALVSQREPLTAQILLDWHEALPPLDVGTESPQPELVAAVLLGSRECSP